jgi:hypothetical protein
MTGATTGGHQQALAATGGDATTAAATPTTTDTATTDTATTDTATTDTATATATCRGTKMRAMAHLPVYGCGQTAPAAAMRARRWMTDLVWIWDTRLSVTPSTCPISLRVRPSS